MANEDQANADRRHNEGRSFGQAGRFELELRWVDDKEPVRRRPVGYGWSMGELRISVAGVALTATRVGDHTQSHIRWYLAPVLDWLASNWAALLHEERTPWTRTAAPASKACQQAFDQWIAAIDRDGQRRFARIQRWYRKHGLRSAATGGVFPDLYMRRVADDVELSWSPAPPLFAPEGLNFETAAGFAHLPVDEVANPLWEMLDWATANAPSLATPGDREYAARLRGKVQALTAAPAIEMAKAHLSPMIYARARAFLAKAGRLDLLQPTSTATGHHAPYIVEFPPAVAMFGGVSPDLENEDVARLHDVLIRSEGGKDCDELAALVQRSPRDQTRHPPPRRGDLRR